MQWCLVQRDEAPSLRFPLRVLRTPWQRLRGLLGSNSQASAVLLTRCHAIHTYGMRYPIDVAFLDTDMCVIFNIRKLPKSSSVSCARASCVVERPARTTAWLEAGEQIHIEAPTRDKNQHATRR